MHICIFLFSTFALGSLIILCKVPESTLISDVSTPDVQFAEWIKKQEGSGAVLLSHKCGLHPKVENEKIYLFANIPNCCPLQIAYFVIHGRPMYTAKPKNTGSSRSARYRCPFGSELDDMAHPMLTGNEIPPSAYDPRSANTRAAAFQALLKSGLQFIAVDLGAYNDEAQTILRSQIQGSVKEEIQFDEGDGVLVFRMY